MSDVDMGSAGVANMVLWAALVMVGVCVWCVYVYPAMVRVYWVCADTLDRVLYHNYACTRTVVVCDHVSHAADVVHAQYTHDVGTAADMVYAEYMGTHEDR